MTGTHPYRLTAVVLLASLGGPGTALAEVRTESPKLAALIDDAAGRSQPFRALLASIDAADGGGLQAGEPVRLGARRPDTPGARARPCDGARARPSAASAFRAFHRRPHARHAGCRACRAGSPAVYRHRRGSPSGLVECPRYAVIRRFF